MYFNLKPYYSGGLSMSKENGKQSCHYCNGTGRQICNVCGGGGLNIYSMPYMTFPTPCPNCGGMGRKICVYCSGSGKRISFLDSLKS